MEHRAIPSTRLRTSVLGLGCGPLGGLFDELNEDQANAVVAAALEAGISYFDTAPLYGMGLSEHRLGAGLRRARDSAVISSKVGRLLRASAKPDSGMFRDALPFDCSYDYSYDGVMRSVEDSLQRMGVNRIDILYIHDVNRRWHGDAVEARYREVMDGGYKALEALRRSGDVAAIGVGMN
ncbi:aldo/keto reductase, partial [Escherichia coli]|nr:aldo/keto reductase [Escherichia coli]